MRLWGHVLHDHNAGAPAAGVDSRAVVDSTRPAPPAPSIHGSTHGSKRRATTPTPTTPTVTSTEPSIPSIPSPQPPPLAYHDVTPLNVYATPGPPLPVFDPLSAPAISIEEDARIKTSKIPTVDANSTSATSTPTTEIVGAHICVAAAAEALPCRPRPARVSGAVPTRTAPRTSSSPKPVGDNRTLRPTGPTPNGCQRSKHRVAPVPTTHIRGRA